MDLNKRLHSITEKNKQQSPQYLKELIKSDFFYLISNYFEVEFNDVDVSLDVVDNKFKVSISCLGDRMKLMRTLPN